MADDKDEITQMSFEAAMAELEKVVARLERGDVPLEESITLYQRGDALKKHCEARLTAAEEKVATLMLDADGNPTGMKPTEGL